MRITHFVPDGRKEGGEYMAASGTIKKIDAVNLTVELSHKEIIPLGNIAAVLRQ